jgi:hypothetical protein
MAVKPYVTAALFCDKVLVESDSTVSIIRIADRITYADPGPLLPEHVQPVGEVTMFVSLKSGEAVGNFTIVIRGTQPTGDSTDSPPIAITLSGGDHGQNIVMPVRIVLKNPGLHWFDVIFDGETLTRIPLILVKTQPPGRSEGETKRPES